MFGWTRHAKRARALDAPFADEWRDLLTERLAHWRLLDDDERATLEDLIRLFLVDKRWLGISDFELTDDIRVLIAAMACLLVLGLDEDQQGYDTVNWIQVHATSFETKGVRSVGVGGVVSDAPLGLLGEAQFDGPVTIAWDTAAMNARHPERGHNVVYHEFAHKLDMADGLVDGMPPMDGDETRARWIAVCTSVYDAVNEGRAGELLDPYAGVNPGEFFAVATETFFDRPVDLHRQHGELYEVLAEFYRQDPAARERRARPGH